MKWFGFRQEQRSATIESPTVPVSADNFLSFFGISAANLPSVTTDTALTVPSVWAAVTFLSRTLAVLPRHVYQDADGNAERVTDEAALLLSRNPNSEMGGFKFWQYFWQQVFTGGRGIAWIERGAGKPTAIWLMNPTKTTIRRTGMSLTYRYGGQEYPAADVIDVPFMLKPDMTGSYGPIAMATKAIQLALAMNSYGSNFFAGGGVPPLVLTGPLPSAGDAVKRAQNDVSRAIDAAKSSDKPIFAVPSGYKLEPVGIDPQKGQMVEARRFQNEEIARVWQLPPVFLQDLTKGTFNNVEQQDLHLVKHLIGQWAKALEDEIDLKVYGREAGRYMKHNLDGLLRGDLKSRIESHARAIQTAQMTPNEARSLENRPADPNPAADELLVQGATVVLGSDTAPAATPAPAPDAEEESEPADAAPEKDEADDDDKA